MSERYHFAPGDEFDLHSCQVKGTYGACHHQNIPGRVFVLENNGSEVVLVRPGHPDARDHFTCGLTGLRAVVCEPYANYTHAKE